MEKSCRKCAPKLAQDPFLILLSNPKQPLHADYQKAFKKLTLFFFLNPVPFNKRSYKKQKGSGSSDQSLFRLQNKFKNIPLFVIYYLTKFDVM